MTGEVREGEAVRSWRSWCNVVLVRVNCPLSGGKSTGGTRVVEERIPELLEYSGVMS